MVELTREVEDVVRRQDPRLRSNPGCDVTFVRHDDAFGALTVTELLADKTEHRHDG